MLLTFSRCPHHKKHQTCQSLHVFSSLSVASKNPVRIVTSSSPNPTVHLLLPQPYSHAAHQLSTCSQCTMHKPQATSNTSVTLYFSTLFRPHHQTLVLTHLFLSKTYDRSHNAAGAAMNSPPAVHLLTTHKSQKKNKHVSSFASHNFLPPPTKNAHAYSRLSQKTYTVLPALAGAAIYSPSPTRSAHEICITTKVKPVNHSTPLHLRPLRVSNSHAYSPRSQHTLHRVSHSCNQTLMQASVRSSRIEF